MTNTIAAYKVAMKAALWDPRVILAKAEKQRTRGTGHDHRGHKYAAYRYVTDAEVASDKSSRNGTEATACNAHADDYRRYQESLHRDNQGGSGQCNPKSHEGSKKLETKPVAIPTYADAYPSSNYLGKKKPKIRFSKFPVAEPGLKHETHSQ